MSRYTITLKSQSFKFSRMLVERKFTETTDEILQSSDTFLEVWDGGSRRYERWPDGTECCWEVVSRHGEVEVLRELPLWDTPAVVMWYEKIPVKQEAGKFQIPGWSVLYTIVPEEKEVAKPRHDRGPQGPHGVHGPGNKRQPDAVANQNVNRRYFSKKRPHMGSGPRQNGINTQ